MPLIPRRINRNIVECKEIDRDCREPGRYVLIETLWNVKEYVFLVSAPSL